MCSERRLGLVLAILLFLPGARFQCGLNRALVGTELLAVREVFVSPSVVSLPVGGLAVIEGFGRDDFGGRVDVQLVWTSGDPDVASVAPRRGSHTVVTARTPGETLVTATHRLSGAAARARVTVTERP